MTVQLKSYLSRSDISLTKLLKGTATSQTTTEKKHIFKKQGETKLHPTCQFKLRREAVWKPLAKFTKNTFCAAQIFQNCVASEVFKPLRMGLVFNDEGHGKHDFCCRQTETQLAPQSPIPSHICWWSSVRAVPPNPALSSTTGDDVWVKANSPPSLNETLLKPNL